MFLSIVRFYLYLQLKYMQMATKINQLIQNTSENPLLFTSWLEKQGVTRMEITQYVRNGWLKRIATGVYYFTGKRPTLFSAISSYNKQLKKKCVISASTALSLRGFSHYGVLGKPLAYLQTPYTERLPTWLLKLDWDMEIRYFTTSIFSEYLLGVELKEISGKKQYVSSPERAFMECLQLSPTHYLLMDLYYLMEMLTTLRPVLLQELLENCTSLKVKRLFLYMAEKSGHQWFSALDLSRIPIGKGKRSLVENGVFVPQYLISVPQELYDYE